MATLVMAVMLCQVGARYGVVLVWFGSWGEVVYGALRCGHAWLGKEWFGSLGWVLFVVLRSVTVRLGSFWYVKAVRVRYV